MRRPIVLLLFALAGGIFLRQGIGKWQGEAPYLPILLLAAVLFAGFFAGSFLFGKPMAILLSFTILAGWLYFGMADSISDPLEAFEGQVATVTGRVISVKDKETYWQMELARQEWAAGGRQGKTAGRMLIQLSGAVAPVAPEGNSLQNLVGKDVVMKGRVSLPAGRQNPGGFDYRLYLKTRGIRVILTAYTSHMEMVGTENLLAGIPARFREQAAESFSAYMDRESLGLLMGMLFGDKTFLDEDLYEVFRRNGTAHILAVSGIHVGIVYLWIHRLLGRRNRLVSSCIILGFLLLYAAMASFSPSVIRAVVMISLHILSGHLYRHYDLLCGASFAAVLMLLQNPFQLFHIGFQLSFLAVFSLAFLLPPVDEFLGYKSWRGFRALLVKAGKIMAPVVVIQVGMAPVIAYLFNYFSLSAFFVNLPVVALAGLILPLGILSALLSLMAGQAMWGIFFGLSATGLEVLMKPMIAINEIFYLPGVTSFKVVSPPLFLLALSYGMIFFLASEGFWLFLKAGDRRRVAMTCCFLIFLSAIVPLATGEGEDRADLVFISVGQGDCLHLRTPGGKNILIDGGGSVDYDVGRKVLLPYLLRNGSAKVDLALATHLHTDHFLGLAALCQEGMVEKLGVYEGNAPEEDELTRQTGLPGNRILYLAAGERILLEEGIWIDILYPPRKGAETYQEELEKKEDENASSLLMKITFRGLTILMTGDLGVAGEEVILDYAADAQGNSLRSDVLKVGHHGSRGSTSDVFLEAVDPRVAIIQAGKNNSFGHPHQEVIEKLQKKDIIIYRNDLQGAVLLDIDKGKIRIRTMDP